MNLDYNLKNRHVLITGASGGIGTALAKVYAAPHQCLTLWGRNPERLEHVRLTCQAQGATAKVIRQDMRQVEQAIGVLRTLFAEHPVDVAVLGAGISSGALPGGKLEPVADVHRLMQVNATATISLGAALLELMLERGQGHLVLISSIAAFFPLPASPAYCAAKSAVSVFGRAMQYELAASPVRISIVYPGYVDSPMSRRLKGPKPQCWSAEKAAAHIRKRLDAGARSIAFPWPLTLGIRLLNILPRPMAVFFANRFSFTIAPDAESPLAPDLTQSSSNGTVTHE